MQNLKMADLNARREKDKMFGIFTCGVEACTEHKLLPCCYMH